MVASLGCALLLLACGGKGASVLHVVPCKALMFSEEVTLPLYHLDPIQGGATRVGEVRLRAVAAAIGSSTHIWAVIRGPDGWYCNDDARPSHRVDPGELDERPGAEGSPTRFIEILVFKRQA